MWQHLEGKLAKPFNKDDGAANLGGKFALGSSHRMHWVHIADRVPDSTCYMQP